jgi:1-aminocyclopropane-1-carboxylate synthase 1/2/6
VNQPSRIIVAAAEAGFSIWTDLRPWLADDSFAAEQAPWRRLFDVGRINMLPGEVFHSHRPGWFRLCHTVGSGIVREGVDRLRRTLTVPVPK